MRTGTFRQYPTRGAGVGEGVGVGLEIGAGGELALIFPKTFAGIIFSEKFFGA